MTLLREQDRKKNRFKGFLFFFYLLYEKKQNKTIIALLLNFTGQTKTIWVDVPEPFLHLAVHNPHLSLSPFLPVFAELSLRVSAPAF